MHADRCLFREGSWSFLRCSGKEWVVWMPDDRAWSPEWYEVGSWLAAFGWPVILLGPKPTADGVDRKVGTDPPAEDCGACAICRET